MCFFEKKPFVITTCTHIQAYLVNENNRYEYKSQQTVGALICFFLSLTQKM